MRQLLILLVACIVGGWEAASADEALPNGFSDVLVAQYLTSPTACVRAPDGRIFIAEQGGAIKIANGTSSPILFATLSVDSYSDRGILGLCCDPDFATNHYLYVYYTAPSATTPDGPTVNRVSRFRRFDQQRRPGDAALHQRHAHHHLLQWRRHRLRR